MTCLQWQRLRGRCTLRAWRKRESGVPVGILRVTVGSALMVEHAPHCLVGHAGPDPSPKAFSGGKEASRSPIQDGAACEVPTLYGLSFGTAAPALQGDPDSLW